MSERETPKTRAAVQGVMLLAMSEHHSGNIEEAKRIVDTQLAALEAAGVWLVPVVSTYKMDAEAAKSVWDIVDSFSMKDAPIIWDAMLAASPYAKDKPE